MPDIVDQIEEVTRNLLRGYSPLPLEPLAARELEQLETRMRADK